MPLADIAPDYRIEGRAVTERLGDVDSSSIEIADASPDWWRKA